MGRNNSHSCFKEKGKTLLRMSKKKDSKIHYTWHTQGEQSESMSFNHGDTNP